MLMRNGTFGGLKYMHASDVIIFMLELSTRAMLQHLVFWACIHVCVHAEFI